MVTAYTLTVTYEDGTEDTHRDLTPLSAEDAARSFFRNMFHSDGFVRKLCIEVEGER